MAAVCLDPPSPGLKGSFLQLLRALLAKGSRLSLSPWTVLSEQSYPAEDHSSSPVTAWKKRLITSGTCGPSPLSLIGDNSAGSSQLHCSEGNLLRVLVQPPCPSILAQFCFLNLSINLCTQNSTSRFVPCRPRYCCNASQCMLWEIIKIKKLEHNISE